ncbi:MAG: AAA family ATPase [Candidatus Marinimicrobia bacterium]|nr:AAA family ATPase [Candidatus Neomarinimicrobiota bacterium]
MYSDHYSLFNSHIERLKSGSGGQSLGLCPFHEDSNPSFAVNLDSGLWKCFAGCGEGNAYQFAEKMGIDPTPYMNGDQGKYQKKTGIESNKKRNGDIGEYGGIQSGSELSSEDKKKALKFNKHLIDNFSEHSIETWNLEAVKKSFTGYDPETETLTFLHTNSKGKGVNIKWHKNKDGNPRSVAGHGSCRLYPLHLLNDYSKDSLIYCEGEKDCLTLLSHGFNAVTGTTGAVSIPRDLSQLEGFNEITIVYDNDKAGKDGSAKLSKVLSQRFPKTTIRIAELKGKGEDITDFFQDGTAEGFQKVLSSAKKIKPPVNPNTPKPFKLITGSKFMNKKIEYHSPLVLELIPYNSLVCIAGHSGVGKSVFVHQLGLCMALGVKEYVGFKITKPSRVLYLNFEINEQELHTRHQQFIENMDTTNYKGDLDNFVLNSYDKGLNLFQDTWERIKATLEVASPPFDMVIVDNLTTSTDIDDERNHRLKPFLQKVCSVRDLFNATVLIVHHQRQQNLEEKQLYLSQVKGGSIFTNTMEMVGQMARSERDESITIFKLTKTRGIKDSKLYQVPLGLRYNDETNWFEYIGIMNEQKHLEKPKKTDRDKALESMPENFETKQFVGVVQRFDYTEKTAFNWLRTLVKRGEITNPHHGYYEKVKKY